MVYELYHHGILGQKWGIRRYQNEDGTLTEAGKRRYAKNKKFQKKIDREIAKKARKAKISGMTDQELQDAINRMQLEDRYNELLNKRIPVETPTLGDHIKKKGKAFVNKIGDSFVSELGNRIGSNAAKQISKAIFGENDNNSDTNRNQNQQQNQRRQRSQQQQQNQRQQRGQQQQQNQRH